MTPGKNICINFDQRCCSKFVIIQYPIFTISKPSIFVQEMLGAFGFDCNRRNLDFGAKYQIYDTFMIFKLDFVKIDFGTILKCFEAFFSPLLNLMKLKTNECRKKEAGGSNLAQNMICQDLLVIRYCS